MEDQINHTQPDQDLPDQLTQPDPPSPKQPEPLEPVLTIFERITALERRQGKIIETVFGTGVDIG